MRTADFVLTHTYHAEGGLKRAQPSPQESVAKSAQQSLLVATLNFLFWILVGQPDGCESPRYDPKGPIHESNKLSSIKTMRPRK